MSTEQADKVRANIGATLVQFAVCRPEESAQAFSQRKVLGIVGHDLAQPFRPVQRGLKQLGIWQIYLNTQFG